VPSADIAKRGTVIQQKMQPGQEVHLTSTAGTDVTFRLAAGKSRVSAGVAADNDTGKGLASTFLPAGDFYTCVDPKSANGVVVQADGMFRGKPIKNVRMTFKDGVLVSVSADEGGDMLTKLLAALDAPSKQMSLINIGLNPESKPMEGSRYLSWEMGGVPTVVVGNSQWAGCAQGGQGGYTAHQPGATLAVGNVEVVKGGALVLD
jgi:aminopeptidase